MNYKVNSFFKPRRVGSISFRKSGYLSELIATGTDEAEERRRNLQELVNAALQYQKKAKMQI